MGVRRGIRAAASTLLVLAGGCAAGLSTGVGVSARAAAEPDTPPLMQATVPFAILLLIGLLISRKFGSE